MHIIKLLKSIKIILLLILLIRKKERAWVKIKFTEQALIQCVKRYGVPLYEGGALKMAERINPLCFFWFAQHGRNLISVSP